jgi:hypothetical protein
MRCGAVQCSNQLDQHGHRGGGQRHSEGTEGKKGNKKTKRTKKKEKKERDK